MSVTNAQIKRWGSDPAAFVEEVLWAVRPDTGRLGPVKLETHQRDWLRAAAARDAGGHFVYRVAVASWPKREGKTMLAGAYGCWRMVTMRRQRIGVLANSERQAQSNVFDELTNFFQNSPMLKGLVPESDFQSRIVRVPALRNKAECYPANWRTVQGTAFDLLLCDELHAAQDGGRAFMFAAQQTEARDAQVIIASQAGENVEQNPLWRYYREATADGEATAAGRMPAPRGHILFDYRTDPVTPWAVRLARQAQRELLPAEYDRLWRNAWGGLGQKLFEVGDIEAAARSYRPPRSRGEWERLRTALGLDRYPGWIVGCGLDRAGVSREGDRTVWTVTAAFDRTVTAIRQDGQDTEDDGNGRLGFARETEPHPAGGEAADPAHPVSTASGLETRPTNDVAPLIVVCDCVTLETGSEAEVLAAYKRTREIYGAPRSVVMEAYGCSDLVGKLPEASIEWPTPQNQQRIFNRLFRALVERRIMFPELAGRNPADGTPGLLKAELIAFEYHMGRQMLQFGTQAGHDDHVYSLAWSAAASGAQVPAVFVQELGGGDARERTQAEIDRLQLVGRAEALWGDDGDE